MIWHDQNLLRPSARHHPVFCKLCQGINSKLRIRLSEIELSFVMTSSSQVYRAVDQDRLGKLALVDW